METILIKITFIQGLRDIVLSELKKFPELKIIETNPESIYLHFIPDFKSVFLLRSIANVFIVKKDKNLHPQYLSKHKSILGNLIEITLQTKTQVFKTFMISCAGSDSQEIKDIESYIATTYKLNKNNDADLKISIGKSNDIWELAVCLTNRPLTVRDYKISNITGAINPSIAYSMNVLCNSESAESYLNIFSGSATLLIEAGIVNPKLKLLGFDNDGKRTAEAINNIKKAGLLKSIILKNEDIFNKPHLGTFDCITSDLPFGMQISKTQNLKSLYKTLVEYCEQTLNQRGTLVTYTTEHELLKEILKESKFSIIKEIDMKLVTSVNSYIYPKIFVCKLK